MSWTYDRVETLKRLWGQHKTAEEIAERLGLSRSAVLGKCMRLGLKRKLTGMRATSRIVELIAEENMPLERAASLVGMSAQAAVRLWKEYRDRYDFGLPAEFNDDIVRPVRA